jgi:hypothetical protein
MSFSITIFGPKHYWWKAFKENSVSRVWFDQPSEHSSGGVGFCLPGLHVVFMWGRR